MLLHVSWDLCEILTSPRNSAVELGCFIVLLKKFSFDNTKVSTDIRELWFLISAQPEYQGQFSQRLCFAYPSPILGEWVRLGFQSIFHYVWAHITSSDAPRRRLSGLDSFLTHFYFLCSFGAILIGSWQHNYSSWQNSGQKTQNYLMVECLSTVFV